MKLSFVLGEAGFTPAELDATSVINFENGVITESHIILKAKVPGISKEVFEKSVKDAELNCPVSQVLKCKISVESTLSA